MQPQLAPAEWPQVTVSSKDGAGPAPKRSGVRWPTLVLCVLLLALGVISNFAARSAIERGDYATATNPEIGLVILAWLRQGMTNSTEAAVLTRSWAVVELSSRWLYGSAGFPFAALGIVLITAYANWGEMDSASKEQ